MGSELFYIRRMSKDGNERPAILSPVLSRFAQQRQQFRRIVAKFTHVDPKLLPILALVGRQVFQFVRIAHGGEVGIAEPVDHLLMRGIRIIQCFPPCSNVGDQPSQRFVPQQRPLRFRRRIFALTCTGASGIAPSYTGRR